MDWFVCFLVSGIETTAIICEDKNGTVSCEGTAILSILYANYGRTSRNICSHFPIVTLTFLSTPTTRCGAPNSLSVITDLCQNETVCTLTSSNFVFGDPCPGLYKYLEVRYDCIATGKIVTSFTLHGILV